MKNFIVVFLFSTFLVTILLVVVWQNTNAFFSKSVIAQTICNNPPTDITGPRWLQGASVKVVIDAAFTETERSRIKNAFLEWNTKNTLNCSNVTFRDFEVLTA